ncbi:MAG: carboxypeptidase regulatory-like domain-containing protein [Lewinella sp.]|nr:carboxypeptidase regulatory-like domain-containing protein [Lewinella sp.]
MKRLILFLSLASLFLSGCFEEALDPTLPVNIQGKVFDEITEAPVNEARITVVSTSDFTETDTTGFFRFDSLDFKASYALRIEKNGYRDQTISVTFSADGPVTRVVEVLLEDDPEENEPPAQPVLLVPAGDTLVSVTPTLRWSAPDSDADDELAFEVLLFDEINPDGATYVTTDTFLTLPLLQFDRRYYWQVIADDGVNDPVASLIGTFRTERLPDLRVHFVREDDATGNLVIYAGESPTLDANPDSLVAYPLTDPANSTWRPHLNLASQRVAYLAFSGPEVHLFSMKRDGTDARQITSSKPVSSFNLLEINYSWSPNGGQLIYPNEDKLYLINENGSGLTPFATAPLGYFFVEVDWSEQDLIAARMQRADRYESEIVVFDLDGTHLNTVVTSQDPSVWRSGPVLAEGSGSVIFAEDRLAEQFPDELPRRTWLVQKPTLDNEGPYPLNNAPIPLNSNDLFPCIPPGGEIVIFVNRPTNNSSLGDIYLMEIDGTGTDTRVLAYRNATMPDWQ